MNDEKRNQLQARGNAIQIEAELCDLPHLMCKPAGISANQLRLARDMPGGKSITNKGPAAHCVICRPVRKTGDRKIDASE